MSDQLPEICYGVHMSTGELILLKAGEAGYWPTEGYSLGAFTSWSEVADFLNDRRGITRAQRAAMEAGSVFGWDLPIAKPSIYDPAGRPK